MTLIALTGYAESGKSTAANYLVEKHGFTRVSFAAPLKKMLRTLDPIINTDDRLTGNRLSTLLEVFEGDEAKIKSSIYGKEYRRLLQVLGTDCVRAEVEDFWIDAADRQMTDPTANYVFDDCRFPNEAQFILNRSPEGLWNIYRHGFGAVNGHVSEQHAGNMGESLIIANARSLEMFYADIDGALALVQSLEGV